MRKDDEESEVRDGFHFFLYPYVKADESINNNDWLHRSTQCSQSITR